MTNHIIIQTFKWHSHPKNTLFDMPWIIEAMCAKWGVIFWSGHEVHGTHNVSRLLGRRLRALLLVDAYKVRQGGTAGEQRGSIAAKEGQQHLFKQQHDRNAFDTAEGGVRQLQMGGRGMMTNNQFDICGVNKCLHSLLVLPFCCSLSVTIYLYLCCDLMLQNKSNRM